MMFTVAEIAVAVGGRVIGSPVGEVTGVTTDSRTVSPGQLFVPLMGERFDGHAFLEEVASKGIRVALSAETSSYPVPEGLTVIVVSDTTRALGDLAACYRNRFTIPVAGITGSNGKTTTKEMLAAILALTGPGLKTSGNLNNLIGLPRMIFSLSGEHEWVVLEMGMSEFGEIDRLARIASPQVGIITNAYPAHLATMESIEGVARAKGELFLRLPIGGNAIYNADDPLISACRVPDGVRRTGFGFHHADVTASNLKSYGMEGQSFSLNVYGESVAIMLRAYGRHNVYNALAAAAAAHSFGIPIATIAAGLASFSPYDKRFQLSDLGAVVLIDDSYNANPASVGAALLTLRELKGERRGIAVLGDMLELGGESEAAHSDVGRLAATCVDRLYLYGEMAPFSARAAMEAGLAPENILIAGNRDEIIDDMVRDHLDGDCIMVKGSRGMKMDLVANALRQIFSGPGYIGRNL